MQLENGNEGETGEESVCLTKRVQFLFERGEHLQREGLTFLPDINELFDLFLKAITE